MRRLLPLLLLALAACPVPEVGPGDEVMGNFTFDVEELPVESGEPLPRCDVIAVQDGGVLSAFDGGFTSFTARFSRTLDGGQAFVSVGGVPRDAVFDGQIVTATFTAPRQYVECNCVDTDLTETLDVALLSTSQNAATGNACPLHALDGGVPEPTGDGGILRPDTTPRGFDAVRACGELTDVVRPREGSNCACGACWMRYAVRGVRR